MKFRRENISRRFVCMRDFAGMNASRILPIRCVKTSAR